VYTLFYVSTISGEDHKLPLLGMAVAVTHRAIAAQMVTVNVETAVVSLNQVTACVHDVEHSGDIITKRPFSSQKSVDQLFTNGRFLQFLKKSADFAGGAD